MFFKSKLTNTEKSLINLTPRVKSIIIGLILSDGWLQKKGHWNPRIGFKQSLINFVYFWHVYNELAILCSGLPFLSKAITRGKLNFSLSLQTRQLECLNEIFNLFYLVKKGQIIKTVKPELFFYIDYLVLAHWIMGDGSKRAKGLILCTDNFNLQEVVLLVNILIIKFNINPTIQKEKNKFRIYINEKGLIKIKPFIKIYFTDSMLYKLNLKQKDLSTNKKSLYNLNKYSNKINHFSSIKNRLFSSYTNIPENNNKFMHKCNS